VYEFHDPAARDVVGHVLDTHPEGQSLLAEAGHRRSLASQSMSMAAEAFARVKTARLGYEALRRRLDPRYGRTLRFGVAVALLAAVAAALVALDAIEFTGVLFGWVAAAAAAAATAAWAGCAWLAALAVREERRGRLAVIAAGAAAAGLLLAALHGEASSISLAPGWHRFEIAALVVLFIFSLVAVAAEIITRTEPASLPLARRRWHRSWDEYLTAAAVHRADAEAAVVAAQEWCSLVDACAVAYAASSPVAGDRAAGDPDAGDPDPANPPTGNGRYTPDPWPGEPPM
jgi:MFS family permease